MGNDSSRLAAAAALVILEVPRTAPATVVPVLEWVRVIASANLKREWERALQIVTAKGRVKEC